MTESTISIFNNREIATIVWTIVLLIWTSIKAPKSLQSMWNFLNAVIKAWKVFVLMISYVGVCVYVLHKFQTWNPVLTKIVIFWFFGWATVALMNSNKIGREKGYFKKTAVEVIGLAVIITFISNLFSFSLWIELLLVPLVMLLAGMAALAQYHPEYKMIGIFSNRILTVLGLVVLGISIFRTTTKFDVFATGGTLQEFLLPMLLSLMFLPFVYIFSIYSRWEHKRVVERVVAENRARAQKLLCG